MKGSVVQPKKLPSVDKQNQEERPSFFKQQLDLISPFKEDPFLAHLTTPITSSRAVKSYLGNLPAYKVGMPPLLRGMNIGLAHGYFIFGPFAKLGPLRETEATNFVGFVSTISVILLLTAGILIYGYVTFKKQPPESIKEKSLSFLSHIGWYEMASGFILGGFGGAGFAYLFISMAS